MEKTKKCTFGLSYFEGRRYADDDKSQNYLVFHPFLKILKMTTRDTKTILS